VILFINRLQPQLSEVVSGVRTGPRETVLHSPQRAVPEVRYDLSVFHCLQSEDLALFKDLLLADPEVVAILNPPQSQHRPVGRLWIFRRHHERRHQLDEAHPCTFEPGVIQDGSVYHLHVLSFDLAVAVVTLPTEVRSVNHSLAKRDHRCIISVYVGVDVPLRRLLLFALVFSATHNGLQMLSDQPEHGDCAYSAHSKRAYPAATGASPSAGIKHRRRPPRRADRSQCRGGCPTAYLLRGTA